MKITGFRISILIVLIVSLMFLVTERSDFLQYFTYLELKTIDIRFNLRGSQNSGNEVVIAAIDEPSIKKLGRWPWSRDKMAQLADILAEGGAKVIGFDVLFTEPEDNLELARIKEIREAFLSSGLDGNPKGQEFSRRLETLAADIDNDAQFAEAIRRANNVILGAFFLAMSPHPPQTVPPLEEPPQLITRFAYHYFNNKEEAGQFPLFRSYLPSPLPLPNLSSGSKGIAHTNMEPDADGASRWEILLLGYGKEYYPPLGVKVAVEYLGVNEKDIWVNFAGKEKAWIEYGPLKIPTDEKMRMLINYKGGNGAFPVYSISDILDRTIPPTTFKDKIVLVGAEAAGLYDLKVTPFSTALPGVEKHAAVAENIIHNDFLIRTKQMQILDLAFIVFLGLLLGIFLPKFGPFWSPIFSLALLFGYWLFAQRLFTSYKYVVNVVYPSLSILLTYTGVFIHNYMTEERQRKWIRGAFNQYLSPHVIDQLMDDPGRLDLGGKEETITAFFSDVQGFTSISERLTAHELVALLNDYLTEMTDTILKYDGTVDKFEGDAIIAFFGAPLEYEDHARRACFVSLDMQGKLIEMRERLKEEGRPLLYMRIGLNTGHAIVGNMGSKQRFDFTMMGDTVNLASRLEGVNKQYGTYAMIGETTYAQAKDFVEARELDRVLVVGKAEPIVVYELLARKGELDEALVPVMKYYADGLELYRVRQWDHAIATFRKGLTINPNDGPSKSMIKRCQEYKENPPPDDWNGAFQLITK